jgi:predicted kinase/hypoxanthine phosphoribosyltransferase
MTTDDFVDLLKVLGGLLVLYELGRVLFHLYVDWREFSWQKIEKAIDKLFDEISESAWEPDLIIGLGRGGTVVAGLLAARFRDSTQYKHRMIPIASIDRFYLMKNKRRQDIRITGFHTIDAFDKRLLLLTADLRSGGTLDRAEHVLKWDRPKEIRTGALLAFTKDVQFSHFDPYYSGVQLPVTSSNRRLPWRSGKYPFEEEHDIESIEGKLVVLHGHVAAGKTSVANAVVKALGFTPLYSDWYWYKYGLGDRKRDRGVSKTHNKHMMGRCWSALGSGTDVVLDSTARWREFRDEIRADFAATSVMVIFVRCSCAEETALDRIKKRRFIGPHDFGTELEYERVRQDFDEISDDELRISNVIDVDTDALTCRIVSSKDGETREAMEKIVGAIQSLYFAKIQRAE